MAKPGVTHGMYPRGEDMAQVSADEFDGVKLQKVLSSPLGAIVPTQKHVVLFDAYDGAVGNSGARGIGAEVFEGGCACAAGLGCC